jgi:hypothetical protein
MRSTPLVEQTMRSGAKAALHLVGLTLMTAAPLAGQSAPADSTAAPAVSAPFSAADQQRYMALGRKVTQWYFGGSPDSVYAIASEEAREAMGGVSGIARQMQQITERAGDEVLVLVEKLTRRKGRPQFWHEGYFSDFTEEAVVFRVLFDDAGRLIGLGISPASQAPAEDP